MCRGLAQLVDRRLHLLFAAGALLVAGSMDVTFFHQSMLKALPLSL